MNRKLYSFRVFSFNLLHAKLYDQTHQRNKIEFINNSQPIWFYGKVQSLFVYRILRLKSTKRTITWIFFLFIYFFFYLWWLSCWLCCYRCVGIFFPIRKCIICTLRVCSKLSNSLFSCWVWFFNRVFLPYLFCLIKLFLKMALSSDFRAPLSQHFKAERMFIWEWLLWLSEKDGKCICEHEARKISPLRSKHFLLLSNEKRICCVQRTGEYKRWKQKKKKINRNKFCKWKQNEVNQSKPLREKYFDKKERTNEK